MRDALITAGSRMILPLFLLGIERIAARAIAEEGVAGALFAGGDLDLAFALALYLCLRLVVIASLATVALAGAMALVWAGVERLRARLSERAAAQTIAPPPP